jgi:hypothetical protein
MARNSQVASIADDGGIDFTLPIARWKGYGGEADFQGAGLEPQANWSGFSGRMPSSSVSGAVAAEPRIKRQ